MALLPDNDRLGLWAEFQRTADCPGNLTKPQLREVVDALDNWWESKAAEANAAIPLPQRTLLTTKQKVALFMALLRKRYEVT